MSIELSRPPARLPPRLSGTAVYLLTGAFLILLLVLSWVLVPWPSYYGLALLFAILSLAVLAVSILLFIQRSFWGDFRRAGTRYDWRSWSGVLEMREADNTELAAQQLLRKGRISRAEYERRIARRRFVHGEVTAQEYRSLLAQIDAASQTANKK